MTKNNSKVLLIISATLGVLAVVAGVVYYANINRDPTFAPKKPEAPVATQSISTSLPTVSAMPSLTPSSTFPPTVSPVPSLTPTSTLDASKFLYSETDFGQAINDAIANGVHEVNSESVYPAGVIENDNIGKALLASLQTGNTDTVPDLNKFRGGIVYAQGDPNKFGPFRGENRGPIIITPELLDALRVENKCFVILFGNGGVMYPGSEDPKDAFQRLVIGHVEEGSGWDELGFQREDTPYWPLSWATGKLKGPLTFSSENIIAIGIFDVTDPRFKDLSSILKNSDTENAFPMFRNSGISNVYVDPEVFK